MADIYVFDSRAEDLSTFGLVGALTPISCIFEEEANGLSELTLEHPIDDFGKFTALSRGNLLVADVPVRTAPEIDGEQIVTSVERWKVRPAATVTKAQRTLYRKSTGSQRMKVLPGGLAVTVTKKPTEGRYKIKCRYGSGWVEPDGIEYVISETIEDNSHSIESVEPAWVVKPQVFRIYNVQKNINSITVSARHIFYDLLYNMTVYASTGAVKCSAALAGVLDKCISAHEFEAYTNLADARTGIDWTRVNPVSALLDPETGLTALYSAALVRDNWDIYILKDPGLNRGVTVEYGKNMTGVQCTETDEEVVTRIIPLGETKDGAALLLSGSQPWIDSKYIDNYPTPHIQTLECSDCKVGTDGVTTAIARARMKEQAQAVFDGGGDLPVVEMSVDFVALGDTAEYAQYKNLDRLFLWDYVIVRHKKLDIDVTVRIVSLRWDCITGRMEKMEIGSVGRTLANTGINTWQIPQGFSGNKIAGGTVGGRALMSDIINARHMQAESINTDALQAASVTAEKLEAGTVKAYIVEAVQAKIGEIVAGKITTDELFTAILGAVKLSAETGSFTFAEVQNLLANTMFVSQGVGDKIQIANLSVSEANIVSLSVGDLLIRNENGEMVRLYVDAEGNVITGDPIEDGTLSGTKLIEGSVTTAQLNAEEIFANDGTVMNLIAGNITANQAFIDSIVTTTIGNLSGMLELYVRRDDLETCMRLLPDGVHVGQSGKNSEVVVTPETVDVRVTGATYSQFASNYVQFGNYQLRRSADGGLVFKVKER